MTSEGRQQPNHRTLHPLNKAREAIQGCWWPNLWSSRPVWQLAEDGLEVGSETWERKPCYITTLSRWGKGISSVGPQDRWQRQGYKDHSHSFLTGTCGRLISGGIISWIPSSCNSPGESWRSGRWRGMVVHVLMTDLHENKGLISVG